MPQIYNKQTTNASVSSQTYVKFKLCWCGGDSSTTISSTD